jgi:cation transport ATPase
VLLPVGELVVGDVLVVRPGESIALDSIIIEGTSAIDQSSLTGESMPVSKKVGDPVFAGTINQTGGLEVRVTKLAKDSTIEKLVRMVEEGKPRVTDVIVDGRVVNFRSDPNAPALELLQLAAAVDVKSEHPLAQAIVTEASNAGWRRRSAPPFNPAPAKVRVVS